MGVMLLAHRLGIARGWIAIGTMMFDPIVAQRRALGVGSGGELPTPGGGGPGPIPTPALPDHIISGRETHSQPSELETQNRIRQQ